VRARPALVRLTAVTVVLGGSWAAALPAASRPAPRQPAPIAVTAYQTSDAKAALITRSAAAIDTVGVDGVDVRNDGASVSAPDAGDRRQLARAHHLHLAAQLLVSNWSDRVEDFAEPVAHRLLADPRHRAAVARSLAADVTDGGFDGISVDLEALHKRDAAGLTAFVRRLRELLPPRASLTVCTYALTSPGAYLRNGYQLAKLAATTDRIVVMTYDQHGPWEQHPGPVGALRWQRRSIAAATHFVPARQLDLGVAGYGYAWRPSGAVQTLSDRRARTLAGNAARFDRAAGEWTATLPDGSVVWWSDHRSYVLRVALARNLGMHGVAVWDLQLADPLTAP
jgi:spore germination protein